MGKEEEKKWRGEKRSEGKGEIFSLFFSSSFFSLFINCNSVGMPNQSNAVDYLDCLQVCNQVCIDKEKETGKKKRK